MQRAEFRFYGSLNDFLGSGRRQRPFVHAFQGRASVKDMIEALGVPHPEVEVVLAGDRSVDFGYHVADGDRLAVYPYFHDLDLGGMERAGAPFPTRPLFVLDVHLRRLAVYLRLLGVDTRWWEDAEDGDLARTAGSEERILLTRDTALLKHGSVRHGYAIRQTAPRAQLREVVHRYGLRGHARPFSRCVRCNGLVQDVAKADVLHRIGDRTRRHYDHFRHCPNCDRVFWRGGHYDRLRGIVEEALPGWRDPRDV